MVSYWCQSALLSPQASDVCIGQIVMLGWDAMGWKVQETKAEDNTKSDTKSDKSTGTNKGF